jgi:excisionase family DNA binding protein
MTSRRSNPPRSPTSTTASWTTGTGLRARPVARLRTIDEAAELLNVSPRTVRRAIESGDLTVHRIGRLVRIADSDIAAFLASNRSI